MAAGQIFSIFSFVFEFLGLGVWSRVQSSDCTAVVFSLLVGARRRSAVRCGAERSGATARLKDFEEQSELEALSVLMEM